MTRDRWDWTEWDGVFGGRGWTEGSGRAPFFSTFFRHSPFFFLQTFGRKGGEGGTRRSRGEEYRCPPSSCLVFGRRKEALDAYFFREKKRPKTKTGGMYQGERGGNEERKGASVHPPFLPKNESLCGLVHFFRVLLYHQTPFLRIQ